MDDAAFSATVAGACAAVVVDDDIANVHGVGKRDRFLAGRHDGTAAAVVARQRRRWLRGQRRRRRRREHSSGRQIGDDGHVVFGRRVHAGLLYGIVQQSGAVRLQIQSQVVRVVVVQWSCVGQWVRVRPVDRELFDDHVSARVRYRRNGHTVVGPVVGHRPTPDDGRVVGRLVWRQRYCGAPTELTVPLSFYLVISFLLLLVLVQVMQNVMQHQIVTVLVLSLQHIQLNLIVQWKD